MKQAAQPTRQRPDLLFFSRGRGRGHATVDIAIAEELRKLSPETELRFASYGTGLRTFVESWDGAFNLDLDENAATMDVLVRAAQLIGHFRPTLVAAHEECGVLPASKIFGIPAIYVTDWFYDSQDFDMTLLRYAEEILFLDQESVYYEPDQASGRVRYFPPVLRRLSYQAADRDRARRELGFSQDAVIVSVFVHPGRRTEDVTPILDKLAPAFESFPAAEKRLVWLTEEDAILRERAGGMEDVILMDPTQPFDQLMAATDVGITKGNRNIVFELAALGVPSISITDQWNSIDDYRTARVPTNTTLHIDEIDHQQLAWELEGAVAARPALQANCPAWRDGRTAVAEHIATIMDALAGANEVSQPRATGA